MVRPACPTPTDFRRRILIFDLIPPEMSPEDSHGGQRLPGYFRGAWKTIKISEINKLIDTFEPRLQAVIKAKGEIVRH